MTSEGKPSRKYDNFDKHLAHKTVAIPVTRREGPIKTLVIEEGMLGRWIIVHPGNPDLAWSGSQWVPHLRGVPTGDAQVSNFATPQEAAAAADEQISEFSGLDG